MKTRFLIGIGLIVAACAAAERKSVFPPGIKPAGPYSPGVIHGDYLYVSGQGPRDANGKYGDTPEANVRQTLSNIRAIVEAAGLTMEHIAYAHVYLHASVPKSEMEKVWKETFPKNPPKRLVFAAHRMPLDIPVEINAIAVRDLASKKQGAKMKLPGEKPSLGCKKAPGGIICSARDATMGTVEEQTKRTMEQIASALALAGYTMADVTATNVQLDSVDDFAKMNGVYGTFFPKESPPTRTTVGLYPPVASRSAVDAQYPQLVRVSVLAVK